jgi:hypothetical protein
VAVRPFARILQAFDSLAWVLRSFDTLILGPAAVYRNLATSCPQAPFFRHVKKFTKEHIFHSNYDFFCL